MIGRASQRSSNGDFEAVQSDSECDQDSPSARCRAPTTATSHAPPRRSGAATAHPHLHLHQPAAHGRKPHDARAGVGGGRPGGAFCPQSGRRHRVQPEGRRYRSDPDFPCRVLEAPSAQAPPPSTCPTRWATPPQEYAGNFIKNLRRCAQCRQRCASPPTVTTTWAWRWPTRWREDRRARARSRMHHQRPGRRCANCSLEGW